MDTIDRENLKNILKIILRHSMNDGDIKALLSLIDYNYEKIKGFSATSLTEEQIQDVEDNTLARHTHDNLMILTDTTASFTIEEKNKLGNLKDNVVLIENLTGEGNHTITIPTELENTNYVVTTQAQTGIGDTLSPVSSAFDNTTKTTTSFDVYVAASCFIICTIHKF
jgi:hypothetical protein